MPGREHNAVAMTRFAPRLANGGLTCCVLLVAAAIWLTAVSTGHDLPGGVRAGWGAPVGAALFLAIPTFGALIVRRLPGHPVGWLFLLAGACASVSIFATAYAVYGLEVTANQLPGGLVAAWLGSWLWVGGFPMLATMPLLLFPNGQLPSRRWRPVMVASIVVLAVLAASFAIEPGPLEEFKARDNPYGQGWADWLGVANLAFPVVVVLSLVAMGQRLRASEGDERQQLRWVIAGAAVVLVAIVVVTGIGVVTERFVGAPLYLAFAVLGGCFCVATLKYRLYDLDVLVNRALVYGVLSALTISLYAVVAGGLTRAFDERAGFGVLGAGLAVLVALPMRGLVQRRVDQLMYGDRQDPYAAVARLGRRLSAPSVGASVLDDLVEAIARAVRAPYVALCIGTETNGATVAAEHGHPRGAELTAVPLRYRGTHLGELLIARRAPREGWNTADTTLLDLLAHQTAPAVRSVLMADEVRRSRERLVTAREEERRRLRRDLHDELGPTLASVALQLEAARRLIPTQPDTASKLVGGIMNDTTEAVSSLRRIVYGLRPPTLDERGLVAAITEQAERLFIADGAGAVELFVDAPVPIELPAAVEVAAYRIAVEALTNVARHAHAGRCVLTLRVGNTLELAVSDDGVGLSANGHAGVGLNAMRERAEELGGNLRASRADPGTVIRASIPLRGVVE
ncbi:MAG TPA: histidine kinase [Mycobacteriales bacterium]|nr:histidine kinase [Mycobacteriales bacterium]